MKIKGVLDIIHSRRDTSGNVYWMFHYTDTETGKMVSGNCAYSAQSNLRGVEYVMNGNKPRRGDEPRMWVGVREMPIRLFKRSIKDLPYAGCSAEEIAKFIENGLK